MILLLIRTSFMYISKRSIFTGSTRLSKHNPTRERIYIYINWRFVHTCNVEKRKRSSREKLKEREIEIKGFEGRRGSFYENDPMVLEEAGEGGSGVGLDSYPGEDSMGLAADCCW